jgi:hypothetical protein
MNPNLFWIPGPWPGRMAVATRPRGGDWLEDEADGWRRAGLDVVVSLLEEEEAAQLELTSEGDIARAKGIQLISFPIPDRGVPASMPAVLGGAGAVQDGCRSLPTRHRAFRINRDRGACGFGNWRRESCRDSQHGSRTRGPRDPRPA